MTAKLKKLFLLITATIVFFLSKNLIEDSSKNIAVKDAYQRADKTPVYIYIKKKDTILGNFGVLPISLLKDSGEIELLRSRIECFFSKDTIDYLNLNCPFEPNSLIGIGLGNTTIYFTENYLFSDSSFVICSTFDTVCWEKTSYIVDRRCVHKEPTPEKYVKINDKFWYNNMSEQTKIYYKLRPHLLKYDKGEEYGFGCVCKHKWKEFWE